MPCYIGEIIGSDSGYVEKGEGWEDNQVERTEMRDSRENYESSRIHCDDVKEESYRHRGNGYLQMWGWAGKHIGVDGRWKGACLSESFKPLALVHFSFDTDFDDAVQGFKSPSKKPKNPKNPKFVFIF